MSSKYIFHIGREKELSLAELEAVLGRVEDHGEFAVKDGMNVGDPQAVMDNLGGTVKLSEVFHEGGTPDDWVNRIASALLSAKPEGKLAFGLNIHPRDDQFLNKTLKKLKQKMKSAGRNARFLNKHGNLTSSTIVMGGLMKHRTDFNIVRTRHHDGHGGGEVYISRTVAVQDFAAYSLRDYEKPARLKKEGMLPPKLAQTMINLTGLVTRARTGDQAATVEPVNFTGKTLYDPFCGSGTILGEALIKGMNVIGSDLDPNAITAAEKNLEWLRTKKFGRTDGQQSQRLFIHDATTLIKDNVPTPPDMVVSETYLGPGQSNLPTLQEVHKIYDELLPLYLRCFERLRALIKPGTPLVVAFPIYHTREGGIRLPNLVDKILPLRYKFHRFLIYRRRDQVVGREIMIFEAE